ncbi:MAG: hypothetical protein WD651_10980 [Acidimicrobiia bacterium]
MCPADEALGSSETVERLCVQLGPRRRAACHLEAAELGTAILEQCYDLRCVVRFLIERVQDALRVMHGRRQLLHPGTPQWLAATGMKFVDQGFGFPQFVESRSQQFLVGYRDAT